MNPEPTPGKEKQRKHKINTIAASSFRRRLTEIFEFLTRVASLLHHSRSQCARQCQRVVHCHLAYSSAVRALRIGAGQCCSRSHSKIGGSAPTSAIPDGYLNMLYTCSRQARSSVDQGCDLVGVHDRMVREPKFVATGKLRQAPLDRILERMYSRAIRCD